MTRRTDANVAAQGSAATVISCGDWGAYVIRHVSDVIFERDDSFAFDKDLVTFRAKWRVDGDVIDTAALNALRMVVA